MLTVSISGKDPPLAPAGQLYWFVATTKEHGAVGVSAKDSDASSLPAEKRRLPRVGFLGVGWVGLHRMDALVKNQVVEIAAIADPANEVLRRAAETAPLATFHSGLSSLLQQELEGLVVATPTALHASEVTAALSAGLSVFCEKPLARTAQETLGVVTAAQQADRLLEVDLPYRYIRGMQRVRELLRAGDIGDVYAAELVFHNAYGPDKAWYYRQEESGGGCLMDLGLNLIDLALWLFDGAAIGAVSGRCLANGKPLRDRREAVEDYAVARIDLEPGPTVSVACSWKLPVGCDAQIQISLHGTKGALSVHNVDGSFYNFRTERYRGTSRQVLDEPPDAWGGRAAVAWGRRLAAGTRSYDPEIERALRVARVIDQIYEG